MSSQILPVTQRSYRHAAQVLGKAFANEPVSVVIYRKFTPERRVRALTVDFSVELEVCLRKGYAIQVEEGEKIVAVAVIYPPGTYPLPWQEQWKFLFKSVLANGWYDVKSWLKWLKEAEKFHPAGAHYYLLYIGVDPDYQGRGYGSAILAHLAAKADGERVGCYLENASPRNLPFYQRFGFRIVQEKEIIGFPTWFMWREPNLSP